MELELIGLIQSVGFPIVAFLLMYHLVKDTIKDNTKAIRELTIYLKK